MFLQPDKPVHLLTELMWRLQPRDSWGSGYSLGLFMTSRNPIYDRLSAHRDKWLFLAASNAEWPPTGVSDEERGAKEFSDLPSLLSHSSEDQLFTFELLGPMLEAQRFDMRARCEVPYEPGYDVPADIRELTQNGLRMLFGSWKEGSPADNIFYLPDIVETEFLGATDCGLCFDADDVPADLLAAFLEEIQWVVHQYIIDVVVSAERKVTSLGDSYRKAYFFCTTPEEANDNGLRQLVTTLTETKGLVASDLARNIIDSLVSHFNLADSDRGAYWRGYGRQAHECAYRVAQIMEDIVFANGNVLAPGLAETIRASGPELTDIDKQLSDQPFFVQQLFRGLRAENELFYLPLYREHFIHSFHAFVIGLVVMAVRPGQTLPDATPMLTDDEVRLWFLVSMWHDIAYSLEKAGGLVETGARRLIGEGNIKRHTGLLPMQPSVGHLFQVENLLGAIMQRREVWDGLLRLPDSLLASGATVRDVVLAVALDSIDHGIWSALMLQHALQGDARGRRVCQRLGRDACDRVFAAIVPHHVAKWGLRELAKQFGRWGGRRFTRVELKDEDIAQVDVAGNSLGYILGLADVLSQAGREAPEFGSNLPSDIGIHLKRIRRTENGRLEVAFHYEKPRTQTELYEIRNEFFEKPAKHLGLEIGPNVYQPWDNSIVVVLDGTKPELHCHFSLRQ